MRTPSINFQKLMEGVLLFVYFYLSREAGYFKSYLPFSKISFNEGFESLPGEFGVYEASVCMFGRGHAITNIGG